MLDEAGLKEDKTRMIRGSGVDLNEYSVKPEPKGLPVIVMASRLLKDKGVFEFVNAATKINEKEIRAHFKLIGEPDEGNPESVDAAIVKSWKDKGVVECLGFRSDISKLFSNANIVVLPSYREGLPKVLIEGAACGRAVITTDVPGCRDAIEPNITGLLVPVCDTNALVKAMDTLINDKSLQQEMGRAGRALSEREFNIDEVVSAHFDIYHWLGLNDSN